MVSPWKSPRLRNSSSISRKRTGPSGYNSSKKPLPSSFPSEFQNPGVQRFWYS